MSHLTPRPRRAAMVAAATAGLLATALTVSTPAAPQAAPLLSQAVAPVPDVLLGETWLRHHREDLMPYWDMPEALGVPIGNFPSFRGRAGELLPDKTNRGLSTLARQVYGYSLAYLLTGEQRYLTYARAGLDWIEGHARDTEHGGWYSLLDVAGNPVDPTNEKDLFNLASLGLAYGMYFNVTRDPEAESGLLAVRDLIFDRYYDASANRFKDALTYDLSTEVDLGNNGSDITNTLVPGTAIDLAFGPLLSAPARRQQFRDDLRRITDSLITRHKNSTAISPANRWVFWGRSARRNFTAQQTDFGHMIKSYEMIYNADRWYGDHPWSWIDADRTTLLNRAWDDAASRWNDSPNSFVATDVVRDSAWWVHAEADQTLAALDLDGRLTSQIGGLSRLQRSAQTWLDVFVDRVPAYPQREVFTRVARDPALTNLAKSGFGKNMLHAHEHALIMYLHGRALEGLPATLHYAFPADQALSLVAKPYWFDASTQFRQVGGQLSVLPGHVAVNVEFTGITGVVAPPYPAPDDATAPISTASISPVPNAAGWNHDPVSVSVSATDDLVGVKEVHATLLVPGSAPVGWISPGAVFALPPFTDDGQYDVTWFAVDRLGNAEAEHALTVLVDRTAPDLTGMPVQPCELWPPENQIVHVADVSATDELSGVDSVDVLASSSEPGSDDDIVVTGGSVDLRAERDGMSGGRTYTISARATDIAGNVTTVSAVCTVPHDQAVVPTLPPVVPTDLPSEVPTWIPAVSTTP